MTAAEEYEEVKRRTLCTVEHLGRATLANVMDIQNLGEFWAKKALEDLVTEGKCFKAGGTYVSFR